MEKNEFKIGQKVRCKENYSYLRELTIGEIYTIEELNGRLIKVEGCPEYFFFWRSAPATYKEIHEASGLKVNDWVKVTRSAAGHENGWENSWELKMDAFVGSVYKITHDRGIGGF